MSYNGTITRYARHLFLKNGACHKLFNNLSFYFSSVYCRSVHEKDVAVKKTIRLLLTMLFLSALTTVHAAPESFQQYYQSIFEFGSTVNQTEELVTFEENGSTYVAEISSSAPVSIYQLQNWGELIPHTSFGSAALQAVDAATGDFNADSITDLVIC